MRAEIIAIGDELTTGQRLDTNSQWLAERLTELGVDVMLPHHGGRRPGGQCGRISRGDRSGGRGRGHGRAGADGRRSDAGGDRGGDRRRARRGRGVARSHSRSVRPPRLWVDAREKRRAGAVPARQPADRQSARHGPRHRHDDRARMSAQPCRLFALPGVPAELFAMWRESVAPAILAAQTVAPRDRPPADQVFWRGREQARSDAARHDPPRPRAARRHHRERHDDHAADHRERAGRSGLPEVDRADRGTDSRAVGRAGVRRGRG